MDITDLDQVFVTKLKIEINFVNHIYEFIVSSEDDLVESALQIPGFPFVPKSDVAEMIVGTSFRRTRGITEECCYKSCTHRELLSYCL